MGMFSMRNLGRFPQGKPAATEPRYPTLINYKVHAGSYRVSIIHQILIWTINVCIWSFLCVRIHTGVGHTDNETVQHFLLWKTLTNFVCALDGIQTSGLRRLSLTLYPLSHSWSAPTKRNHTRTEQKKNQNSLCFLHNEVKLFNISCKWHIINKCTTCEPVQTNRPPAENHP